MQEKMKHKKDDHRSGNHNHSMDHENSNYKNKK